MADAIKGNITIESGSVDKAAASIERLNASLKASLKSAKALNAELKKTRTGKSGRSTAENSLRGFDTTKISKTFGTVLANSVRIKDNLIRAGKSATHIRHEFSEMLRKITAANANVGRVNGSPTIRRGSLAHYIRTRNAAGSNISARLRNLERLRQDGRIGLEQLRQRNRIELATFDHANRERLYERRQRDIARSREEREQRGEFRRRYYAERQFDMVRDQFIGHGFGTSLGVFKNLGGIGRQRFFDWYIDRQTRALGLDPLSQDYQLERSAIMHGLVNQGGAIMRVVGLVGGVVLTVGKVFLKLSIIITKVIAKIHMMGAAIGALTAAIGAVTAAQEYDRYRGQMTKLMVSHDMFANNTILPFDEKAKHDYVNENYKLAYDLTSKNAMRGLDTVESGIRLAHLVGVGEGGGFKTDDEAMNFTRGLIAAAQVNGMTDAELHTLQYQGSQIASKGYAELLDIKPLMNSAPGIINDLIKFTGMSREELLKSGKTRELTWEKFKSMFVTNRAYYETLASRRDSQTIGSQFQAAKQAFGLGVMGVSSGGIAEGGVKDIMQELAGSDLILVVGQMLGEIAGEFVKWFVKMFADEGDNSIRGAITNFGLAVIDFFTETAHVVVDLIGNVRLMWHTFGETFKRIVRFLAGNALTRGILENVFGGKLPKWALPDDEKSNEKYTLTNDKGEEIIFGGDMRTERGIDAVADHMYKEAKAWYANEIADVTKKANELEGFAAKGLVSKEFAGIFADSAKRVVADLQTKQRSVQINRADAAAALYGSLSKLSAKDFEDWNADVKMGIIDPTLSQYKSQYLDAKNLLIPWEDTEYRVKDGEAMKKALEDLGINQTEATIISGRDKIHKGIDEAADKAREGFQNRADIPANRTTNELLGKIEANTGKGKAALDRVTDVLVEFTKNRVINNITRVRPNVVVNFGDISDTSSINFAMSEMTSKLKHAIENVAGEDTVTLQIGGING